MNQRSIALYLAKKGLPATAINRALEETLGPEAVVYSTMTMYFRTLSLRGKIEEEEIGDYDQLLDEVDEAILKALADEPFSSVRELARDTCLSRTTVHRHLTRSLGFTVRHLRWGPHRLAPGQKAKWVALSRELLSMLDREETRDWRNIITLDESWFYLCTDHELIWLAPGRMVPERERHMIQSLKSMITVAWNTSGFHVLAALPKGAKFNASYYSNEILEEIRKWRDAHRTKPTRSLIVHVHHTRLIYLRQTFSVRSCQKNVMRMCVWQLERVFFGSWGIDLDQCCSGVEKETSEMY
jgi:AraC-like DNA-binding protein